MRRLKRKIQSEFQTTLYKQLRGGIKVEKSTRPGKYSPQVVENEYVIPYDDVLIGIQSFFMDENGKIVNHHKLTYPREVIIQTLKHHSGAIKEISVEGLLTEFRNLVLEIAFNNSKSANMYELSNAILNYFALKESMSNRIQDNPTLSLGFVISFKKNALEDQMLMAFDYNFWEMYSKNVIEGLS